MAAERCLRPLRYRRISFKATTGRDFTALAGQGCANGSGLLRFRCVQKDPSSPVQRRSGGTLVSVWSNVAPFSEWVTVDAGPRQLHDVGAGALGVVFRTGNGLEV